MFLFQNNVFQGIFTRIKRKKDSKGLKKSKIRLENSRKKHDIFPKKTTRSTIKHDTNLIVKHDTESWVLAYRTIPGGGQGGQGGKLLRPWDPSV